MRRVRPLGEDSGAGSHGSRQPQSSCHHSSGSSRNGCDIRQAFLTPTLMISALLRPEHTMRTKSQSRTRSSEIAFLRTVLVWLSIPYQLNNFRLRKNAISDERAEIAHFVRITEGC